MPVRLIKRACGYQAMQVNMLTIEGVGRLVTVDNSLCGAADNSQGQNLKYQRGASRSLVPPTCE